MSSRQQDNLLCNPAHVISVCAVVFPISLVFLAIGQYLMSSRLPSSAYLVLAVMSGFFCTLATCLSAHSYVKSADRRGAISIQIAVGLIVIWGGFVCCLTNSNPLSSIFSELRFPEVPHSTWVVENRDGVDWLVPPNQRRGEAVSPATQAVIMAVLFASMAAPYFASWAVLNLFSGTRFRILISMTCVSWAIVGIAWRHSDTHDPGVGLKPATTIVSPVDLPAEEVEGSGKVTMSPEGNTSDAWYFSNLSSVALAILFAIPAYLSVPFVRLFMVTFMDTNDIARLWLVSTVSSLLIIVLMTLLGPRLVPDQAVSFVNAGVVLSLLSAWIIMPTIYDSKMLWISTHVCGLTWMAGGFFLLGRPWSMEQQELIRALSVLIPAVTLTLLHLLFGLYQPRLLRIFKSLCWAILSILVVTICVLLWLEKAPSWKSFSFGLWLFLLTGPYAQKPPEIVYLSHAVSQRLSIRRQWSTIRKLVRLDARPEVPSPEPTTSRFYETRDPAIQSSIPDGDPVRFIIRRHQPEWREAVTFAVVIVAMIALALSVSILQFSPTDKLHLVRNDLPWYAATAGLCWIAGWLMLKRHHLRKQALVLSNENVGWWTGSEFEWLTPYNSIREVRVWAQKLAIVTNAGNRITTRPLSLSGALASAGFIQNKNFKEMIRAAMQSLHQLGQADIGPIRFTWLGLTLRQHTIHWTDIESINLNANGISVSRKGGPRQWAFISARHLSNPMCLKMLVYYFFGMQKFLNEATGVSGVSPADFERVCRSVKGLDEFGLLDQKKLTKAVIAVFSYQLPHSFSHLVAVDSGWGEFPGEESLDQITMGEAWRELVHQIASHVPFPEPLCELLQPTEDFWIRGMTAIVEHEAARQATPC